VGDDSGFRSEEYARVYQKGYSKGHRDGTAQRKAANDHAANGTKVTQPNALS
jgi:hypothetical protein